MAWNAGHSGGSWDRLTALPEEVVLRVCRHLTPHDVLSLRHANRRLRSCVGPTFFAAMPANLSLYSANPVLDAFAPGTLTAACVHFVGQSASPVAVAADVLLSSPHLPCLLHVALKLSSDQHVRAAESDMHAFVRRLRDTESLAALVDLLPLPSSTSSAALSTGQEPGGLSHLSRLTKLELQCHVLSQAGLVTVLQLVSELPSLRTLVMKRPRGGGGVVGQLPVNLSSESSGKSFKHLCLEEVELRKQSVDCSLQVFSGMQFLKILRLDVKSVQLKGPTELDLPRLEGLFITTSASVVIPLYLPSLRTLHVVHGYSGVALDGLLSDALNLESIVLAARDLTTVPDIFCLADATGLHHLQHVEFHRQWLGPEASLQPLSHVRRISVTEWDVYEPPRIEAALAGLEATEHLSIQMLRSSCEPPPLVDHFATVPKLTHLSLTCPQFSRVPQSPYKFRLNEVTSAFPCHLYTQLESLELLVPRVYSRRRLLQPMPRLAELHLHVRSMADIHPSWMCMLPGLRRLSLTLKEQPALECVDVHSRVDNDLCSNVGSFAHAPGATAATAAAVAAAAATTAGAVQVAPCAGTSKGVGGSSHNSNGSSRLVGSTGLSVGGGKSGGNTTAIKFCWPHVRRLKVEVLWLHRFQWAWLTMFPDLLVFQLAADPDSFPRIPPMGSPSLPRGLFEVHLLSKEHVSRLQHQQRNLDPRMCIRVRHLNEKSHYSDINMFFERVRRRREADGRVGRREPS